MSPSIYICEKESFDCLTFKEVSSAGDNAANMMRVFKKRNLENEEVLRELIDCKTFLYFPGCRGTTSKRSGSVSAIHYQTVDKFELYHSRLLVALMREGEGACSHRS